MKSNFGILLLFEPDQRGTALRVYTVTDKVADVKAELKNGMMAGEEPGLAAGW